VGYLVFGFAFLALVVLAKHLTFFRSREGDYPSSPSTRFAGPSWARSRGSREILILQHLKGMPVLNAFYRAMGARIGRNVLINTCNMFDFDLIEIGDGTFIGGTRYDRPPGESGLLKIRPVRIGRRCIVGQSSVVFPAP